MKVLQQAVASEEVVNRTLAAYVEVCCSLGTPQRGLNAVHFQRSRYRRTSNKHLRPVKDIRVYNTLLRGFASFSDFNKVQEVLNMISEEEITPDVHSYAAVLECLGRLNIDNNHLKYIRIQVNQAKQQGITFDRIMNDCIFTKEQKEFVVKAMNAYNSNYKPEYELQNLQYDNSLLKNLNVAEKELKLPENTKKANSGVCKRLNWNELIVKQTKFEADGFVVVCPLMLFLGVKKFNF